MHTTPGTTCGSGRRICFLILSIVALLPLHVTSSPLPLPLQLKTHTDTGTGTGTASLSPSPTNGPFITLPSSQDEALAIDVSVTPLASDTRCKRACQQQTKIPQPTMVGPPASVRPAASRQEKGDALVQVQMTDSAGGGGGYNMPGLDANGGDTGERALLEADSETHLTAKVGDGVPVYCACGGGGEHHVPEKPNGGVAMAGLILGVVGTVGLLSWIGFVVFCHLRGEGDGWGFGFTFAFGWWANGKRADADGHDQGQKSEPGMDVSENYLSPIPLHLAGKSAEVLGLHTPTNSQSLRIYPSNSYSTRSPSRSQTPPTVDHGHLAPSSRPAWGDEVVREVFGLGLDLGLHLDLGLDLGGGNGGGSGAAGSGTRVAGLTSGLVPVQAQWEDEVGQVYAESDDDDEYYHEGGEKEG